MTAWNASVKEHMWQRQLPISLSLPLVPHDHLGMDVDECRDLGVGLKSDLSRARRRKVARCLSIQGMMVSSRAASNLAASLRSHDNATPVPEVGPPDSPLSTFTFTAHSRLLNLRDGRLLSTDHYPVSSAAPSLLHETTTMQNYRPLWLSSLLTSSIPLASHPTSFSPSPPSTSFAHSFSFNASLPSPFSLLPFSLSSAPLHLPSLFLTLHNCTLAIHTSAYPHPAAVSLCDRFSFPEVVRGMARE